MAKPLKVLLITLGVLLLALAGLVTAAIVFFDANALRERITVAVKKETGRELLLGDIQLGFFPWIKAEISGISLSNAPGFGPQPMLTAESLTLGVKLLPLLRDRQVQASTLRLAGVNVQLAVNAEGISNWADLSTPAETPATDTPAPDTAPLEQLDIAGVELERLALRYTDARSGSDLRVDDLRLKTGRLRAGDAFPLQAGGRFSTAAPATQAAIELAATLTLDAASGSARVQDLQLQLDGTRAGSEAAQNLAAALKIASPLLEWDGRTRRLNAAALTLDIARLAQGAADAPRFSASGQIKTGIAADLVAQQHQLNGFDATLALAGSALPGGKPQTLKLQTQASADLARNTAVLDALHLAFAGVDVRGALRVQPLTGDAPEASGAIEVASFSPRTLLAALGIAAPKTADEKVLQQLAFKAQLSASARQFSLKDLDLKLDDTRLQGDFAVRDFATQALVFRLKADTLDADRYLPTPVPAPAGEKPAEKVDINRIELPVAMLEKLNAEGRLDIATLKLKGVAMTGVQLELGASANGPRRQKISAGLFGGRADLALSLQPGATPGIGLKTTLSSITAGPLLKHFLGKEYVSGDGSVTLDLSGRGSTVGALRRSLNGDVAFSLVNGAVQGFNLGQTIRDGQALLALKSGAAAEPATKASKSTDFAELRGAATIVNGVLKSDQLSAKNPLLRLEGAGEVDLVAETINYLAKPTLVGTSKGQGGRESGELRGITIPIRLTGGLFAPKVSIDWQAALKQGAVDQLRSKLGVDSEALNLKRDEAKTELKQKAADEINRGLLKLFGGKKKPDPAPAEPAPATPP